MERPAVPGGCAEVRDKRFEGSGAFRRGRDRDMGGACRYSRRLTPCGRGLRQPPGLTALGCQGSACDRLRLTGKLRAFAQGSYEVSLRWRGGRPYGRHFLCRLWRRKPSQPGFARRKTIQPPYGRGKAFPLWWLAPPPCPVGSMSLDSRVAWLPHESSSFATPAVRWGGKRKAP